MKLKCLSLVCLLSILAPAYGENDFIVNQPQLKSYLEDEFIAHKQQLKPYYGHRHVVMIASPGRSGSTLLTDVTKRYATHYTVLKTHLLPPSAKYKGKILFIFSNPDKAAESALHRLLLSKSHGTVHFSHVETADQAWFNKIERNASRQTAEDNLLAYDALGCATQLEAWLHKRSVPCRQEEAQILAIKYENLWDAETVAAIKNFLHLRVFKLPPKEERGCGTEELTKQEFDFKALYNVGTEEEPIYRAYDKARELWEQAPSLQFLKLVP